jgi:hypothetical protein
MNEGSINEESEDTSKKTDDLNEKAEETGKKGEKSD